MNFMIAVDLEGCAGVHSEPNKTLGMAKDYTFACEQGAREASAAARALFDAGADRVLIWDNHSSALNLPYDLMPEECEFLNGVGRTGRFSFVDAFDGNLDAALFLGYHSRDNTANAVIAHTYSSIDYQYVKVNGVERGEIEIDAFLLGEKNIPLIFVASDDKACVQTKAFLPSCNTLQTKQSLSFNASIFKHPHRVAKEIYSEVFNTTKAFMADPKAFPIAAYDTPVEIEMRFKRLEGAQDAEQNGYTRFEPYCARKIFPTLGDYMR